MGMSSQVPRERRKSFRPGGLWGTSSFGPGGAFPELLCAALLTLLRPAFPRKGRLRVPAQPGHRAQRPGAGRAASSPLQTPCCRERSQAAWPKPLGVQRSCPAAAQMHGPSSSLKQAGCRPHRAPGARRHVCLQHEALGKTQEGETNPPGARKGSSWRGEARRGSEQGPSAPRLPLSRCQPRQTRMKGTWGQGRLWALTGARGGCLQRHRVLLQSTWEPPGPAPLRAARQPASPGQRRAD